MCGKHDPNITDRWKRFNRLVKYATIYGKDSLNPVQPNFGDKLMNTPFDDTLQSLFDSSLSAMPETPTFGQDFHTSSAFDPHSFAQTYQIEHCRT